MMKTQTPVDRVTAAMATPAALAALRESKLAFRIADLQRFASTPAERADYQDAIERFLEAADRYDVIVYGPVA